MLRYAQHDKSGTGTKLRLLPEAPKARPSKSHSEESFLASLEMAHPLILPRSGATCCALAQRKWGLALRVAFDDGQVLGRPLLI